MFHTNKLHHYIIDSSPPAAQSIAFYHFVVFNWKPNTAVCYITAINTLGNAKKTAIK